MLKNKAFVVAACILSSFYILLHNSALHAKAPKPVFKFQAKTFKVKSLPFDINGMHLQFQYTVKEDISAEKPKEMVLVIDKKLVDITRRVVVLDFPMEQEDLNPTINLSDIDKAKYSPADFDDVNFDGYKDIREECKPCSGSLGTVEEIYLFNQRTRKFERWQSIMGINVEIDPKNKTVHCYTKGSGDGQFNYQEIKFIGRGIQLYEKKVDCVFLNEKTQTFKVTYHKYNGKKITAHKTRIITYEESVDPWHIIDEIKK